MKCKNCGHKIIKIKGVWKHSPSLVSAFGKPDCEWNCQCKKPVKGDIRKKKEAVK